MFRTIPLSIIRSLALHTQQWYTRMSYRLQLQLASVSKICMTQLLRVQCQTPDDGQRNCPKHIEIYSKINLGNS